MRTIPPFRVQFSERSLLDRRGGVPVGHLRVGAASKGSHRGAVRVPVLRTPGGLLKRLGRAVLWLLVLVLLLRGVASVMEPRTPTTASTAAAKPAAPAWPDDGVRAFASDFARAFLTYNPKDPDASAAAIRAFVGPEAAHVRDMVPGSRDRHLPSRPPNGHEREDDRPHLWPPRGRRGRL